MRILVTGGAGFLGSHLVDRLMENGDDVICLDNYFTGNKQNIARWIGHPHFESIRHDITQPIRLEVDQIYHLAGLASPSHYQFDPVKTVKTSVLGTINMLGLAKRVKARFFLASTSEVYGDPEVHPQREDYWGNVNPIGIRSCYEEGKRIAETIAYEYYRQNNVDVRVARIFNTYGPRMFKNDGGVVSNFIIRALQHQPLTVYGDGSQTRTFCYVTDTIDGFIRLMASDCSTYPVNIGSPTECTILQLATQIRDAIDPSLEITFASLPLDDPRRRCPDIGIAKKLLQWEPTVNIDAGLQLTIDYLKQENNLQVD